MNKEELEKNKNQSTYILPCKTTENMLHGYTNKDTRKAPPKQKRKDSIETSLCCHEKVVDIKRKGYVVLETIKEKKHDNRKTE